MKITRVVKCLRFDLHDPKVTAKISGYLVFEFQVFKWMRGSVKSLIIIVFAFMQFMYYVLCGFVFAACDVYIV